MKTTIGLALVLVIGMSNVVCADVVIVKDGKPVSAIYADPAIMAERANVATNSVQRSVEKARVRLRESVKDLSGILERISGANVPVYTNAPAAGDKAVPIFIGSAAEKKFRMPGKRSPYKQGWRIVVSKKGVGLFGESDKASSYAIYELLDRLGCRWYMPGEMGEVLPSMKTIKLKDMDVSEMPVVLLRDTWFRPQAFARRNRLGGIEGATSAHCLEAYLCSPKNVNAKNVHLLEEHPEWNAEVDGERKVCGRICWASDGAAKATGDIIIKQLDEKYTPSKGLAPADTVWFCECKKCKALDADDFDPAYGQMSITDRYINYCNKIVKRVHEKYPEMIFGTIAYEQYTRPPVREKPDPSIYWMFAPILYCRSHSFMNTNCWSREPLKEIVEGWGKATDKLMFRDYGYHLAEVTAPFPMITKWSEELPFVYKSGWTMWRPETMDTYEVSMPGLYLGIRLAWKPTEDPKVILDEMFTRFYGNASKPMRDYWMTFDRAWTDCDEHAGCLFSYAQRFTPEVMKKARKAVNKALKSCKTDMEERRVTLADESLKEFELYMKMYRDLLEGKLANLKSDKDRWLKTWGELSKKYKGHYVFSAYGPKYTKRYVGHIYDDASRIAKDYKILTRKPLLKWQYMVDKEEVGKKEGWFKADFDSQEWKTRDISVDTWSDLGLWTYYGAVWNRVTVKLPRAPKGKKVYLWVSRTDGYVTLYVNGQHVKYVSTDDKNPYIKKGDVADAFHNYSMPGSFDITSAVKPGKKNQITIVGDRGRLFELGTGGLVGPVYIYCEK